MKSQWKKEVGSLNNMLTIIKPQVFTIITV